MNESPPTSSASSTTSSPLLHPTDPAANSTAPSTPGVPSSDSVNPMDLTAGTTQDQTAAVASLAQGVQQTTLDTSRDADVPTLAGISTTDQTTHSASPAAAAPSQEAAVVASSSASITSTSSSGSSTSTISPPTTPAVVSPPPIPAVAPVVPTRAAQPPPLFPRSTAPASLPPSAAPGGAAAVRRPPASGLRAGVRGAPLGAGGMKIPPSLAAKMAAMTSGSRSSTPPATGGSTTPTNGATGGNPLTFRPSPNPVPGRAVASGPPGAGGPARGGGMMARRRGPPGLTLSAMKGGASEDGSDSSAAGVMRLPTDNGAIGGAGSPGATRDTGGTPFSNFRKIVDPSGRLNFASKAVVHADGVDFSSGASFKIKMDDFELFEELGKGNYGTVQKVWHKPTKVTMALKEIRLELDDSKLKTIITELDILHRATSPYIIDFYGAFFIESCVYYCMEYMDGGSLEVVAGCDVPEDVLSRTTRSIVEGLKFLKDELKIMHRDVKPTNVLLNRNGSVKLCDFGVSGQLDRSIAKTNIGCQSYMAPERIKGESQGVPSSYTASSDVWSLGLSIIEFAIGHYPYPPETYQNVFAQLTAIVHGDPPALPDRYSETARDFVAACLEKVANRRPTYGQLLEHPFLKQDVGRDVDMVGWIAKALDYRAKNPRAATPALA